MLWDHLLLGILPIILSFTISPLGILSIIHHHPQSCSWWIWCHSTSSNIVNEVANWWPSLCTAGFWLVTRTDPCPEFRLNFMAIESQASNIHVTWKSMLDICSHQATSKWLYLTPPKHRYSPRKRGGWIANVCVFPSVLGVGGIEGMGVLGFLDS